jgi:hypothetical protein
MLGKQVYSAELGLSTYANIDLTSAASGIFLLTVTGETGTQKTIKLVKN